jgi:CubicO group peptidase (beta-lactamase class C family)
MTGDEVRTEIRRRITTAQIDHRLPSLTVGVAHAGKTLCLESVGVSDAEVGDPALPGLQYRIGSITKTFTAALVLTLAERGLLGIDEPVAAYLPDTTVGPVLVRQLLAHIGGVQREAPHPMWATMQGPDRDALLDAFTRVESVDVPGTRWHYSNLGYAILGQVVHSITGSPCEDVIARELLEPLGLTHTTWRPVTDHAIGYRLDPYRVGAVHREPDMDQAAIGVAGQLWSTAEDLLTWGHALLGHAPDVLPPHVTQSMRTLQVMVDAQKWSQGWGLGLILERRGDLILSGHTGAMPGFLAALSMEPDSGLIVTAFTNVTRGIRLADLCADLIAEILPHLSAEPASLMSSTSPPTELAGVLGRWWSESEETVFTWEDQALHAHLADSPDTSTTTFAREAQDSYRASAGRMQGERLHIMRDDQGDVTELEWATYPYRRSPR